MKRADDGSDVSRETPEGGRPTPVGSREDFRILATDLGFDLDDDQVSLLQRYGTWLIDEAMPAGGIGPEEGTRLFDRHLADSLAYVPAIPPHARRILDVGSGVGLPGIPTAIARPHDEVTLLDRSDRRTWLARRAVRVLGLVNVDVITGDVHAVEAGSDAALFRASLTIDAAAAVLSEIIEPHGVGLVGVSRLPDPPELPPPPTHVLFDLSRTTSRILDSPFWLLRMRLNSLESRENTAP